MRGMNSESVDLIYLDPPFNSKHNYAAPIGSKAAGAAFKDTWSLKDVDRVWVDELEKRNPDLYAVIIAIGKVGGSSNMSYMIYMAVRMLEIHRLLKPTGSIYIHSDPTMSHSLKLMMDAIFGKKGFRNEIIWHYRRFSRNVKNSFPSMHDTILFYAKDKNNTFNKLFDPDIVNERAYHKRGYHIDKDKLIFYTKDKKKAKAISEKHNLNLEEYNKISYIEASRPYLHNVFLIPIINPMAKERTGYPTQKPLALLERIIKASSNEDDTVFDPFCGCATTLVAAEKLKRKWIGIDISSKAVDLVKSRLYDDIMLGEQAGEGKLKLSRGEVIARTDTPKRTDLGKLPAIKTHKNALYGEQGGNCMGCKKHFEIENLEIDHIIPKADGGTDHIDNLQLLCGHCNRVKGKRTMEELLTRLSQRGIGI
jgi:site-specific DNA-methyltransferase (adenine-specific)